MGHCMHRREVEPLLDLLDRKLDRGGTLLPRLRIRLLSSWDRRWLRLLVSCLRLGIRIKRCLGKES